MFFVFIEVISNLWFLFPSCCITHHNTFHRVRNEEIRRDSSDWGSSENPWMMCHNPYTHLCGCLEMLSKNAGCMRRSQDDYLRDKPRINQTGARGETRLDWTPPVLRCHTKEPHWTTVQGVYFSYDTQCTSTRHNVGMEELYGTFVLFFLLILSNN